jgi:succinate dehydrogenase/fumarate reductase cytochrome b subunit
MNEKRPYQRFWMNKKRPIPAVADAQKETSGIGLFLFIHNLWRRSFFSSPTSGMGLFSFLHNLWYSFLFIHPQTME